MSYHLNNERGVKDKPVAELPQEQSVEEVPHEAQEQNEPETQTVQEPEEETPVVASIPVPEGPKESFRELRQKATRMEHERDEALRRLQERENSKVSQAQAEDDSYKGLSLADDEIMEGKHGKELFKTVKRLEQELNQYKQQVTTTTDKQRLQRDFPDFEKVVNDEMLKDLRAIDPDSWEVLNNSSASLYSTGKMAYNAIKAAGLVTNDTPRFIQDRLTAQKNANKPRPLTSISAQQGDSPMSRANAFASGLTDDLKKQLLKEMMEARNA